MLVLINPNAKIPAPNAAIEPPLWLSLMAGYQQSIGKDVTIIDAEAEELTNIQVAEVTRKLNPKEIVIVVMGNNPSVSSTPKMPVAEDLLRYLPEAKLAGLHPKAVNHEKSIPVDFVGFPKVPWNLLPMDKYRAHNWHCLQDIDKRKPYGVLYTSTGCPFKCFYCNIHTLYGDRKVRYRPLADIFADLDYFATHGIKNIKIWDELFCLDTIRVEIICDYIIANGYDFNFWAYARVDTVNPKMLSHMKKAGINWLAYGFESGSEEVRQLSKKGYQESDSHKAIAMTRATGINIMGNFIFGLPGDTLQTMQDTYEFAVRENFEYVNFYCGLPYPGSEWYEALSEKPVEWDWFNQYSKNIFASRKVVDFRDEAFREYFNRPSYLNMIQSKFGVKAREHILDMLKWQIR